MSGDESSDSGSGSRAARYARRLLRYARRGSASSLRRLLRRHAVPLDVADERGCTALHLAAEGGHTEAVQLLLRRGADGGRPDSVGDSAAHAAARWVTRGRPELLLSFGADALGVRDRGGRTARDVAARLLSQRAALEAEARRPPPASPPRWRSVWDEEDAEGDDYFASYEAEAEAAWAAREEEAGLGDEAQHAADWRRSARAAAEAAAAAAAARGARAPPGPAQGDAWAAWKAAEAARVLAEERARDAAWRGRVAERSLEQRRADYLAGWQRLERGDQAAPLAAADVPWPAPAGLEAAQAAAVLLAGVPTEKQRDALRAELRRWHPDRFGARLGARLPAEPGQAAAVWARVNAVCQALTDAYRQLV